jgi:hypothetical protein
MFTSSWKKHCSVVFRVEQCKISILCWYLSSSGPGSSVGIETDYGLDCPVIESRWGARFSAPVQTGFGAHPASCTMGTGPFPGVKKRPGRDADPSPLSSAVGHKRVEQYLYFPYGLYGLYRASVPVQGCTLLVFQAIILIVLYGKNVQMSISYVLSIHYIIKILSACNSARFVTILNVCLKGNTG